MNKKDLKQLIKEINNPTETIKEESKREIKDTLGKFFIVTKPSKNSKLEDILVEVDLLGFLRQLKGGLTEEEIIGVFSLRGSAATFARDAIKNTESQLKEIEDEMEEYRKGKLELDNKKAQAKEKILKLKG